MSRLNEADSKLFAFCMGGVATFYDERKRIGGRYFAFCHVLGELTFRQCRIPTMAFLTPQVRAEFRQQLCEIGRQAMHEIRLDENVTRIESRDVIDLAVGAFSAKGKACDMQFSARGFAIKPDVIDTVRLQQSFPHEYHEFLQDVRKRVMAGSKPDQLKR